MHFNVLYVIKDEENLSFKEIEKRFCDKYCYCCGETHPEYAELCDWFQIGGRWCDEVIHSSKGIKGEKSYGCGAGTNNSIANIADLTEPLDDKYIAMICDDECNMVYRQGDEWWCDEGEINEDFLDYLNAINNKLFKGTIATIDCHD